MATPTPRLTPLSLAVLIGVVFAILHVLAKTNVVRFEVVDQLEERALDRKFILRGRLPVSNRVALAAVDERSVQVVGRWPWNRADFAQAMSNLAKAEPAAVAFDMFFVDPDHSLAPEQARELGALVVIDAVARLVPGILGNAESAQTESFEAGLLEHPQAQQALASAAREQVQALLLGAELLPCFLPGLMLCLRFDGVAIRSHGANWILGSTAQR